MSVDPIIARNRRLAQADRNRPPTIRPCPRPKLMEYCIYCGHFDAGSTGKCHICGRPVKRVHAGFVPPRRC